MAVENDLFDSLTENPTGEEVPVNEGQEVNTDIFDDIVTTDPTESDVEPIETSEQVTDEDVMTSFLKQYGVTDPKKMQFENDNGEIEEVDFNSLDKEEQMNVLKSITDPGLSEHEIEVVNYLRKNNASFDQVIDYFANKRLEEYLNDNPDQKHQQSYSIDDYTDEELYWADLKAKFPNFSEDEITSKLNIAKTDENLFKKEVNALRELYKAEEDRARQESELAEKQEYEYLRNSLASAAGAFNEVILDNTDPESDAIEIEENDRKQILAYLLNLDKDGKSQFVKDIENPEVLVELAWHRMFGQQTLSGTSQYFKSIIKEDRKKIANLEKQLEKYKNKGNNTVISKPNATDSPSTAFGLFDDLI